MRMTLYETVKSNVTTLQAAERYGLKVGHGGMCKCPFHNDKNPSMKVDKRFHCFGCQADGDVINFTSRLFDLTPKAAALKLADDFGIHHDPQQIETAIRKPRMISEKEIFDHKISYCYQELVNYRNLLVQWQQQYAPMSPDEEWHPLFIYAVHTLETVEQELDTLLSGSDYEKREIVSDHLRKKKYHGEDYLMEPTVNVPVYPESAAHARKFGELEQYRKSHFANIDCKKDIEQAISENFDGFRLNKRAAEEIIAKYDAVCDELSVDHIVAKHIQVIGFDINKKRVDEYAHGIDATNEVGPAIKNTTVDFTSDASRLKEAKFIIVAVPTPVNKDTTPDLKPVEGASRTVGQNITPGTIVVFESTVYPGVTEDVCVPIIEKESGLKCGVDWKIGYSPERINPGDRVHTLTTIRKVVSGMDDESAAEIKKVYDIVIKAGTVPVSNIKTAEAVKVVENSQRDINIAFMNEIAIICDKQ